MNTVTAARPACLFPAIDPEETGKYIYRLLEANGYQARKTAELLGNIKVQTVYNWKYGKRMPSIDNLDVISRLLNVSINDLLVHDPGDEVVVFFCVVSGYVYNMEMQARLRDIARITLEERADSYARRISAVQAA